MTRSSLRLSRESAASSEETAIASFDRLSIDRVCALHSSDDPAERLGLRSRPQKNLSDTRKTYYRRRCIRVRRISLNCRELIATRVPIVRKHRAKVSANIGARTTACARTRLFCIYFCALVRLSLSPPSDDDNARRTSPKNEFTSQLETMFFFSSQTYVRSRIRMEATTGEGAKSSRCAQTKKRARTIAARRRRTCLARSRLGKLKPIGKVEVFIRLCGRGREASPRPSSSLAHAFLPSS